MVQYWLGLDSYDSTRQELYTSILNHLLGKKKFDISNVVDATHRKIENWNENKFLNDAKNNLDKILQMKLLGPSGFFRQARIDSSDLEKSRVMNMEINNEKVEDFTVGDLLNSKKKSLIVGFKIPQDAFDWQEQESFKEKFPEVTYEDPAGRGYYDTKRETPEFITSKTKGERTYWLDEEGKKVYQKPTHEYTLGDYSGSVSEFDITDFEDKDAGDTIESLIKEKLTEMWDEKGSEFTGRRMNLLSKWTKDLSITRANLKKESEDYMYVQGQIKIPYPLTFQEEKREKLESEYTNVSFTPTKDKTTFLNTPFGEKRELSSDSSDDEESIVIEVTNLVDTKHPTKSFLQTFKTNEAYKLILKEVKELAMSNQMIERLKALHKHPLEVLSFDLVVEFKGKVEILGNEMISLNRSLFTDPSAKGYVGLPYTVKLSYTKHGTFRLSPYGSVRQKGTVKTKLTRKEGMKGDQPEDYDKTIEDTIRQYKYQPTFDAEIKKVIRRINSFRSELISEGRD